VSDHVDAEVELLQGREQQLGVTGEVGAQREVAQREEGLHGVAVLTLDLDVAAALGHRRHELLHVGASGAPDAAVERERGRGPVRVEVGLADAADRGAAHHPLQLERGGSARRQVALIRSSASCSASRISCESCLVPRQGMRERALSATTK
jgi:hypothetical protein